MRRNSLALVAAIAVLALSYASLAALARPRPEHPLFAELPAGPLVIAHQGGDGLWPSNTLYAFERAHALGADMLELDVHASRDGELVVIHDDTVDRTTDGAGPVRELSLAQLKELDAGYDWSPGRRGEEFPYRGLGITIPTLREVLTALPEARFTVEIKQAEPRIAEGLCRLLRELGRQRQVVVGSFHGAELRAFRDACPEVATSAAQDEVVRFFALERAFLGRLYRSPAEALQVPESRGALRVVRPSFLAAAQRANVDVHVWTVNETVDMERLLEMGVDGVITDRPDRLLRLLGRGGEAELPPGVAP